MLRCLVILEAVIVVLLRVLFLKKPFVTLILNEMRVECVIHSVHSLYQCSEIFHGPLGGDVVCDSAFLWVFHNRTQCFCCVLFYLGKPILILVNTYTSVSDNQSWHDILLCMCMCVSVSVNFRQHHPNLSTQITVVVSSYWESPGSLTI